MLLLASIIALGSDTRDTPLGPLFYLFASFELKGLFSFDLYD